MTEEIKRIGDYEILSELGAGGMGRVYKVRNTISDRIEAMKILLPDLAGRQELAARFLREIKLLASLNHPNIAQLRTAFTNENQLVMIMEYVEGVSMATHLSGAPISVADAINYIDQVLNALGYAHEHNVIHRDIKPGNMMLTPQGLVKVMDFGIARSDSDRTLTQAGTSLGTVNYMSPEQVKGEATDPRSDIYSVGVCLYEMVTGKKPFNSGSDYSIMAAHVNEVPRPPVEFQPELPPALNQIILIAIAKEPARRFQTATAFRNALNNVRGTSAVADVQAPAFAPTGDATATMGRPASPATSVSQIASFAAAVPAGTQVAATPSIPIPPPAPASHRGLYMTLGALIVLAGLVFAGIYLPKRGKADDQAQKAVAAPAPAPVEPAPAPVVENPVPEAPVVLAKGGGKMHSKQGSEDTTAKQLDELRDEIDHLAARAASVNASLDRLKQQQAAAGYGLRGDMAEREESMKINLSRAQDAAEHNDLAKAQKYYDRTTADLEALEHFVGR
ncbi:MAG: serine/threonine protein kinase [Acidobacteria bacterium]|nr:serine/threonine protein kinase [Acidobacteriota bacterium]